MKKVNMKKVSETMKNTNNSVSKYMVRTICA